LLGTLLLEKKGKKESKRPRKAGLRLILEKAGMA